MFVQSNQPSLHRVKRRLKTGVVAQAWDTSDKEEFEVIYGYLVATD